MKRSNHININNPRTSYPAQYWEQSQQTTESIKKYTNDLSSSSLKKATNGKRMPGKKNLLNWRNRRLNIKYLLCFSAKKRRQLLNWALDFEMPSHGKWLATNIGGEHWKGEWKHHTSDASRFHMHPTLINIIKSRKQGLRRPSQPRIHARISSLAAHHYVKTNVKISATGPHPVCNMFA